MLGYTRTAQGLLDGEGKESFFFGLAGARTGEMTPADALVNVARKSLVTNIDNPREISESWIKREILYPLAEQEYALASRASNSPFGIFHARQTELKADFIAAMAKEYAAGNKDYELISLYYDKRQNMYERLDELESIVGIGSFEVNEKDPIASALSDWRDIYDLPIVTQALKDERWDILDAEQATLMETFSEEQ